MTRIIARTIEIIAMIVGPCFTDIVDSNAAPRRYNHEAKLAAPKIKIIGIPPIILLAGLSASLKMSGLWKGRRNAASDVNIPSKPTDKTYH